MQEEDDLFAAMIAGVAEQPPWQAFVLRLRALFGATHANVIFRRSDLALTFITLSSSPEVEKFGDLTVLHIPEHDPIPYYEMEPFRAYDVGEFLMGQDPSEHPFISRFLGPLSMDQLLICRATAAFDMQAWITVTRGQTDGFTQSDAARLERISRLFGHALAIFGKLKTVEDQRDAYVRAVRARATGLIQLDQNGAILHLDEQARSWVEDGSILRISHDKLRTTSSADRPAFESALARVLREQTREEFLALEGPHQTLELLICRSAESFEPAWTHGARAVVYLAMIGHESAPMLGRLVALFGLTRREGALAQLLSQGCTLGAAAAELGISEQTARTYLRQIFQKTRTSRQAELVRRIQGSLAGLA